MGRQFFACMTRVTFVQVLLLHRTMKDLEKMSLDFSRVALHYVPHQWDDLDVLIWVRMVRGGYTSAEV